MCVTLKYEFKEDGKDFKETLQWIMYMPFRCLQDEAVRRGSHRAAANMSSLFPSGATRILRAVFSSSKEETIGFVRFHDETLEANEVTIPNGSFSGKDFKPDGGCYGASDEGGENEKKENGMLPMSMEPVKDQSLAEKKQERNRITAWQAGWNVTNAIQVRQTTPSRYVKQSHPGTLANATQVRQPTPSRYVNQRHPGISDNAIQVRQTTPSRYVKQRHSGTSDNPTQIRQTTPSRYVRQRHPGTLRAFSAHLSINFTPSRGVLIQISRINELCVLKQRKKFEKEETRGKTFCQSLCPAKNEVSAAD